MQKQNGQATTIMTMFFFKSSNGDLYCIGTFSRSKVKKIINFYVVFVVSPKNEQRCDFQDEKTAQVILIYQGPLSEKNPYSNHTVKLLRIKQNVISRNM